MGGAGRSTHKLNGGRLDYFFIVPAAKGQLRRRIVRLQKHSG
jgi:hypothetical protein